MPDARLRVLLDEHYPGWLADELCEVGVDAQAVIVREDLRGASDTAVLQTATSEGRIVVTEDVNTFAIAIEAVPDHSGVIFCHHARFPRTRPGLARLRKSLTMFAEERPAGRESPGFVWWLAP